MNNETDDNSERDQWVNSDVISVYIGCVGNMHYACTVLANDNEPIVNSFELGIANDMESQDKLHSNFFDVLFTSFEKLKVFTKYKKNSTSEENLPAHVIIGHPTSPQEGHMMRLLRLESQRFRDELSQHYRYDISVFKNTIPDGNDEVVIYSDASRSINGTGVATTAWVETYDSRKIINRAFAPFDFSVVRSENMDKLEALGILLAVAAHPGRDKLVVFSDSINGIELALREIRSLRTKGAFTCDYIRSSIRSSDVLSVITNTEVDIRWVKSHDGNFWIDVADFVAVKARHTYQDSSDKRSVMKIVENGTRAWMRAKFNSIKNS